MPRKATQPSLADEHAAPGGAAAVDRALSVLAAFRAGDGELPLAELAARTRLYKSTVLRLLASLEHGGLVRRSASGHYALGAEVARLHAIYAASFALQDLVLPVLRELAARTRESAAYHVAQGGHRLCLYRVDSPQPIRDHIRAGDLLPLDRGAGGRVLSAYAGANDAIARQVRREQVIVLEGDRMPELSGISAPVFGADGALAGAVTLTMPTARLVREQAADVLAAARTLTRALGGVVPAQQRGDTA
ncbi:IclR family transcriptional regulator [Bordetella genomosp. 1]|uniref:IclR family transcriptional regulator n=1 Tax=Bordetella genomosp. 1 TaxID=1395607 RepID=A0A261SPM8_9BORD|nr:IclR family transcriptional regulator [Bordetella genomosp. 1]MDQ8032740.1 IclR family transcriptional regulator [Bordetella sp.]OZI38942.1 IclR family transcriptional regulator [Bordetella genomosp. 1]